MSNSSSGSHHDALLSPLADHPPLHNFSNGDHFSSSSLDFLARLNDVEPSHGLLIPSKKRTNSNFAYTMILRDHTYHVCYRRQTPRGERVYWRCQLRGQCKARLITDLEGKIVQFTNPVHSHPSSTRLNGQQRRCLQALLTKLEENVDLLNAAGPNNLPPSSSPDNECPTMVIGSSAPNTFESPPSTLSSNSDQQAPVHQSRKRSSNPVNTQKTGEIDLEEILSRIPQLQNLKFDSYYNNDVDENNAVEDNRPLETITEPNLKSTETDETVYEDTDSSSVASPNHLNDSRQCLLGSLVQNGWKYSNDSIKKCFVFSDFNGCFGYMNRIALKAESLHRYPAWTNNCNRVEIRLPSLSQSILTVADLHLAKFIDEIYHR